MKTNTFKVAKLVLEIGTSKPYFIIESYPTSDGIRSRICDGRWSSQEQAEAHAREKLNRSRQ